jgi:RNA polymerase sigma factor (TIGR02999 family)
MPLVYGELHRLAHRHLRRAGRSDGQIQTTALVHESYLRLLGASRVSWQNRAHFFALSAELMRRVLVDAIRTRRSQKRGADSPHVSIEGALAMPDVPHPSLVALDDALNALAAIDPRKAKVVELRYFGGLSEAEVADVLGISLATVERDWRVARLWLSRELKGTPA